jgi:hypothetical protein
MPEGQKKHQLTQDAEAFDRAAALMEWFGALASNSGETDKAADCAGKAQDLKDLAALYRTAIDSIGEEDS